MPEPSWRIGVLIFVALLLAALMLASCDTRHVVEVCLPFDTLEITDSTVIVHRVPC